MDVSKDASPSPIYSVAPLTSVPINIVNTRRNFVREPGFRHTNYINCINFSNFLHFVNFTILLALVLRRVGRLHLMVGKDMRLLVEGEEIQVSTCTLEVLKPEWESASLSDNLLASVCTVDETCTNHY